MPKKVWSGADKSELKKNRLLAAMAPAAYDALVAAGKTPADSCFGLKVLKEPADDRRLHRTGTHISVQAKAAFATRGLFPILPPNRVRQV